MGLTETSERYLARVLALARDADERYRRIANDMIRECPRESPELLLSLLELDDRTLNELVVQELLAEFPVLRAHISGVGVLPKAGVFGRLEQRERDFFATLETLMARKEPSHLFLQHLSIFPGIRDQVTSLLSEESRKRYEAACRESDERQSLPRQLTVVPTYRCNLRCPYCISRDVDGSWITERRWNELLDFAALFDVETIVFTGGEPTLHPTFPRLVQEIEKSGFNTYFATNGLFGEEVLSVLRPETVRELVIHVRDPNDRDLPPRYLDRLSRNLDRLVAQGVVVKFRYNIYRQGQDFGNFLRLIEKYRPPEVGFSLSVRGRRGSNQYIAGYEIGQYTEMILELVNECECRKTRPILTKPLPPCLFGEDAGLGLLRRGVLRPYCSIFTDGFARNVIVNPDLTVAPCFGMDGDGAKLSDYASWEELGEAIADRVKPLLVKPFLDECSECYLYSRGLCQGACLATKLESFVGSNGAQKPVKTS